jgi:hypothetical protein
MTVATELLLDGIQGERDKAILAMVVARAWRDADYRGQLLAEPKPLLIAEGLEFPQDAEIEVVENTPSVTYINLTRGTTEATSAISALERLVPVPVGHEVRLVQSTEQMRYFVIPAVPEGLEIADATDVDLDEAASRVIRNYIYVYTAVFGVTAVDVAAEVVAVVVIT